VSLVEDICNQEVKGCTPAKHVYAIEVFISAGQKYLELQARSVRTRIVGQDAAAVSASLNAELDRYQK
jgi:hypothetical protein